MNPIPTKENLGLPWRKNPEGDDWNLLDNQRMTIGISYFEMPLDFAIHAANTYHDREALLMECLDFAGLILDGDYLSDEDIAKGLIAKIKATLTPPAAT